MSTMSDCVVVITNVPLQLHFMVKHHLPYCILFLFSLHLYCITCVVIFNIFFFFLQVCLSFLGRFYQSLKDNDVKFNSAAIEKAFIKFCKDAKGKENRLVSIFLTIVVAMLIMTNRLDFKFTVIVTMSCFHFGF